MTTAGLTVTIDGPAGVGKTTVGLLLAARLRALFVDTGLFYRGLTALALAEGVSIEDGRAVARLVPELAARLTPPPIPPPNSGAQPAGASPAQAATWPPQAFVPGMSDPDVEAQVSAVASQEEVRSALLPLQRQALDAERIVAAGRDLGSVVFPDADAKLYLDASLEERARRRAGQAGQAERIGLVAKALAHRDETDSTRRAAPLALAPGAIRVSTDGLSVEEVVEQIEQIVSMQMAVK